MLASQVNLDHRLAELRQAATDRRDAHAARGIARSPRSLADAVRSLLGWTPASHSVRASAH